MLHLQKPIAVTMGDPCGVGPEITLLSWLKRFELELPLFYCIACPDMLQERAEQLGYHIPFQVIEEDQLVELDPNQLPVIPLKQQFKSSVGAPTSANAGAIIESIECAVRHVQQGFARAVTTNPIAKSVLYDAGFKHPGHTEFLGELTKRYYNQDVDPVMLLAGPDLMTVPMTVHIPLKDVANTLTSETMISIARCVHRDLQKYLAIQQPRIAIAGLNPHAGEDGSMGREEIEFMRPAIKQLQDEGLSVTGPHPADTLFHERARQNYDVVLAAYHDQALIPVKTIAFDETVNATLGLPFVRTSPDHGTAFDIAGHGIANPESFAAALRLASAFSEPESL
ncbi:4-hydroxythreonine-4-phosphate dehydrogenase PdxA [Polycladidibacter stylochi]|uniref:4-hydroxythreonine-4-phosphate dehydrogenase PdxA n=1 Tax=Polycladidibacter stylochi TaxID=1807766 RepID=UPI0008336817|nr:4-hydroxythreonine-4-phosphate dehydrogenase PdxA [Pseudovibrio stylochi]